ncbi:MAG: metalloregulator ArsR/SmtB family transcription factor [Microthrixaceae bacterium]
MAAADIPKPDPVACSPVCPAGDQPSVAALRTRQPDRASFERAGDLLRLVGDPTRLALVHALVDGGELCVCDLAAVVGVSENAASQALRLLRAADVVRTRRAGRRIYYRLADAHVRLLVDVTMEHIGHDDPTGVAHG